MEHTKPQAIYLDKYTSPFYWIDQVLLEIELGEEETSVMSQLTVRANSNVTHKVSDLELMGENQALQSVAVDGQLLTAADYKLTSSTLTLFDIPSECTITIKTLIKPQENTSLSGLYKSSGNFCTQCEAEGFRRITYFLDRPDVMARFTTTIIADEKRYPILLSNGNLIDSGKLADGKHWVKWQDPFKKPSYLFALVAGDFDLLEDTFTTQSGNKVSLCIYVEKGHLDKCAHAMQGVKKAMRWDEEQYGREYDLSIYMIVAVSDFNMGAMENKGLNIFNTKYILAKADTATDEDFIHVESVIAHEYFHNWTGNRITCRDWFQLSLKEGLTIFRDQSFTADTASRAVARIHDVMSLRAQQFPEDAGPLAHAVRPESYIEINNFYTATIYNKGAEVIRMMKTLMGDKAFRRGMDLYFERHDGQAVTINDFAAAMEDAASVDLTQFKLWYSQAGTPQLTVTDEYDADNHKYRLTLSQSCPATPGQPTKKPFHIPVLFGLLNEAGEPYPMSSNIIELKHSKDVFEFENITSKPIPSLLRHFSAPIKLNYQYTPHQLQVLFKHDVDAFNRWEAGQQYATHVLLGFIKDIKSQKTLKVPQAFMDCFRYILQYHQDDKYLLAEMLTLPSVRYIADQMQTVDVDAIYQARDFMLAQIASQFEDIFYNTYLVNHVPDQDGIFTIEKMGQRQLKNLCLFYLSLLGKDQYVELCKTQFAESVKNNMTDTIGVLRCLTHRDVPLRKLAFAKFYEVWQHDALVMDKWFALQAISTLPNTLSHVVELLNHPGFDIKNPNKVYSLIGAFGQQNMLRFHAEKGEGYEWLANMIQTLDELNPQVAARMVRPLTEWRRFDKKRQQSMLQQLKRIMTFPHLSPDVYELVSKSVN